MDYLAQLNAVADLSVENMRPNEFAVYMRMLFFNNGLHWKEWFSITYERLSHLTGISSKDTIATAINSLEQNGYLEVKRLGKRQGNRYRIIPLYIQDFMLKAEQTPAKSRIKDGQKAEKSRTKPPPLIRRDEKRREETYTRDPDILTNDNHEGQGELSPAEQQVRSAFETHFRPLTKLEELDTLRAFTGDYGSRLVVWAIERVSERVQDASKRRGLSPRYLLPLLQEESSKQALAAVPLVPAYDPGRPEGPDNRPPHIPPNWVWTGCGWEEPFVR